MVLEYAAPTPPVRYPAAIWVAVFCALVPLALGTIIFCLFLATRDNRLATLGIILIAVSFWLFPIGLAALAMYGWGELRQPNVPKSIARQIMIVLMLLLSNFPAALLYASIGGRLMSEYSVEIINHGSVPIEGLTLTGPAGSTELGALPSGASKVTTLQITREGAVVHSFTRNGVTVAGTIDGYVTPSMGAKKRLMIWDDKVEIE